MHDRNRQPRHPAVSINLARPLMLIAALGIGASAPSFAQTPSPLQEWQYSSVIVLEKLFQPDIPDWRDVLGVGVEHKPLYDGSPLTRTQVGPVINIRYRDIAFASIGEGLGVNVFSGPQYRAGIALGYDLGRRVSDDVGNLHGLNDIARAPLFKMFGSYVISKDFPLVLRADVRQIIGGADGMQGDVEAYMPLPGSSKRLIMFAGPSITFSDRRYTEKVFGVTAAQTASSGYDAYDAHGGLTAAGFGFSATTFVTEHWLVNVDAAIDRLLGSARDSPITKTTTQRVLALSLAYSW